ncbi:hypothetical protein CANARDRAFT_8663 [[Candida] arabinofermentans NRRL YB-2248]|uniref:CNH domain-containing protein n=1 Tax=[Candida] arabinofermentans NRRL YB-2248 TaxID=983967 RepID=A0A1E4SXT7_9ASCO|nr:hypothetical protein CANARDRAFT_8663 [[Candida] arabinofermentans NRRL YB-2248]
MVVVIKPFSSLNVSLGNGKITSSNVINDLLFIGLNNSQLLVYQLNGSIVANDDHGLQLEDLNLIQSLKLSGNILQIEFLKSLNYFIVLLSNSIVEVYNLDDFKLIDKFDELKFNLLTTWSDDEELDDINKGLQLDSIDEQDTEYLNDNDNDSISLATVHFEKGVGGEEKFTKIRSNYNFICLVSKRNIVILRWLGKKFNSKFEFKLNDKIQLVEFLTYDILIVVLKNGDIVKLNLLNGQMNNIQIQFLNSQLNNNQRSFFFNNSTTSLIEIFKANNDQQLVILKDNNLIKLNNDLELINYRRKSFHSIDFKNPIILANKFQFLKYWFPYLVLIYPTCIELRNLENGSIVQQTTIDMNSIVDVKFTQKFLLIITNTKILKFIKSDYDSQLKQFEDAKDYNNAINLIEKLNPLLLSTDCADFNHSPKQIKFLKLRQFQLMKATELLKHNKFEKAFHLFIEFMAPPNLVLDNLPESISRTLTNDDDYTQYIQQQQQQQPPPPSPLRSDSGSPSSPTRLRTRSSKDSLNSSSVAATNHDNSKLINLLITYLTDTRRKLTRLLDPDSPKFQWHGYQISLELYDLNTNGIDGKLFDSLELIDDYLFHSYLATNPKMIGPLLRISNYCNFEKTEKSLLGLKMYSELIDFYYCRSKHASALELLNKLCFEENKGFKLEFMIRYLQKLSNSELELIFIFSKKLIEINPDEYFKLIFMNDSIECESLNKFKVLDYLAENGWMELQIIYLEYLIFEINETNNKFCNRLIELYLLDVTTTTDKSKLVFEKVSKVYELNAYSPSLAVKKLNSLGDKNSTILRLLIHPLSLLNKQDEVLNILVNEIGDNSLAIQHCLKIYKKDKDLGVKLFDKLIDLHISNNNRDSIVEILNHNLNFLDPISILQKLPNDLEVEKLTEFLNFNLRNLNSNLKSSIIASELLNVQLINLKLDKLNQDKQNTRLDSNSKCVVCDKTFNANSILSFYPNGTIVHYGCSKYYS